MGMLPQCLCSDKECSKVHVIEKSFPRHAHAVAEHNRLDEFCCGKKNVERIRL